MERETALNVLLVALGAVVLYVAWGNAGGVLGLGDQCLPTEPQGLHLDPTYQIVYEHDVCTAYVFEHGRAVFVGLSAFGLGSVSAGLHRLRQPAERPATP